MPHQFDPKIVISVIVTDKNIVAKLFLNTRQTEMIKFYTKQDEF